MMYTAETMSGGIGHRFKTKESAFAFVQGANVGYQWQQMEDGIWYCTIDTVIIGWVSESDNFQIPLVYLTLLKREMEESARD